MLLGPCSSEEFVGVCVHTRVHSVGRLENIMTVQSNRGYSWRNAEGATGRWWGRDLFWWKLPGTQRGIAGVWLTQLGGQGERFPISQWPHTRELWFLLPTLPQREGISTYPYGEKLDSCLCLTQRSTPTALYTLMSLAFRAQEDFFSKTSKAQTIKGKCSVFDYVNMKHLSTKEDTGNKGKGEPQTGRQHWQCI